jgi:hypothetical protein
VLSRSRSPKDLTLAAWRPTSVPSAAESGTGKVGRFLQISEHLSFQTGRMSGVSLGMRESGAYPRMDAVKGSSFRKRKLTRVIVLTAIRQFRREQKIWVEFL